MDPILVAVLTAGVTALVTYVLPKLAAKTKTTVDDAIVEYVRKFLPDIVRYLEGKLEAQKATAASTRPAVRDHRTPPVTLENQVFLEPKGRGTAS